MKTDRHTIKLLVLIQGLQVGGLEKMAIDLMNNLPENYKVTVCCFDTLGPLEEILQSDIDKVLIKRKSGINITYPLKLKRLIKDLGIDILHAHNNTAFFYGTLAGKMAGIKKIIYTEHGRTGKLPWKTRKVHGFLSGFVNHTVVVADYLKNMLIKDEGFNGENISIIPNGIDGSPFSNAGDRDLLKKELGLDSSTRLIGMVARLDPIKNHDMLIRAMKEISIQEPKARLLIVGDGVLRDKLEMQTRELNLDEHVIFLGERKDVPRIMNGLDVFTLTSWSEGMSLTLVEAMASQLPIVATEVGGNPSIIKNMKNGILVPPDDHEALADSILKVLNDPELSNSLSERARYKFQSEYTLEKMVQRYCDLYDA